MSAEPSPGRRVWRAFHAGQVKRWHTHGYLIRTQDIAQHSNGVVQVIVLLHPDPSARLLKAAVMHDFGELKTGDMPRWAKKEVPTIELALEKLEQGQRQKYGVDYPLGEEEQRWLAGADLMDAWLFLLQNILCGNEMVRGNFNGATQAVRHSRSNMPEPIRQAMEQILSMHPWVRVW
jgi:hypothetical protein